jgi:outer membrane protein assembly factor BamE (lipoprotein component of BamABCDE complex)
MVLRVLLISGVVLLFGCSRKSAQDAGVDSAVKRYERVRTGMLKQDVLAMLGDPSNRQEGRYRWEVAGRPQYNASIEVKFDREDRITSIARSRSKD